jgi:hypothetical protein
MSLARDTGDTTPLSIMTKVIGKDGFPRSAGRAPRTEAA